MENVEVRDLTLSSVHHPAFVLTLTTKRCSPNAAPPILNASSFTLRRQPVRPSTNPTSKAP
eukprot:64659-Rhodomonas_salina.1